jgi:hypothetical protein
LAGVSWIPSAARGRHREEQRGRSHT